MAHGPRVVEFEHVHIRRPHLSSPDEFSACCYAAAFSDGEECTCWRPVIEPEPVPLADCEEGPMQANASRCDDCAYRRDSLERQAIGGDPMSYTPGGIFLCHTGMPRAVAYKHHGGAVREHPDPDGPAADYEPIRLRDRAWRADGRPAVVCAGWAADDRAYQRNRRND